MANTRNIDVSDWTEVFDAIYANHEGGDSYWGLQCKDEWINTGCCQANEVSEQADRYWSSSNWLYKP